jgi:hypothetical protein
LSTATLDITAIATFSTSALGVGSHSITAVYGGDTNFKTSTSPSWTQAVNPASNTTTTTTLTSSANPSVYGQAVTLTARVAAVNPGAGTPSGTVTFKEGTAVRGIGTLSGGQVQVTTSTLTAGSHEIVAVYSGDAGFNVSTSSALTQTINLASTLTSLTASANPSVFGQTVTFTVRVGVVSPGSGTPSGSVTFKEGTTILSTMSLDTSAIAIFLTSALGVGTHSITAVYNGDARFSVSKSTALTQTVDQSSTTTGLTSTVDPSVYGQAVTFTARVAAVSPGAGTPSGTVTFKEGTTVLGFGTLSGGQVRITTSSLTTGSHAITAAYSGDTNFKAGNAAALTQTVNAASTVTSLTSTVNPSVYGQAVTFTAFVVSPGVGTPSGTVTFSNGMAILGIKALDASGMATLTISTLQVGSYWVAISYTPGNSNYRASTAPVLTQIVATATTLTSVTSSANPSGYRQPVTFTATVAAASPGAGTPSGTVTFRDGRTVLGTRTLDSNGVATLTTSSLRLGSHAVTAVYQGNSNFRTNASGTLVQTVKRASTSTSLTSSVNPSGTRRAVTYTATVAVIGPSAGSPTGTVTFRAGSTVLGTRRLNARGMASLTTRWWRGGGRSITAVYQGNASYRGSTSAMLRQMVYA